jgi:16S rRNA (adenine1518-N6/adenine1519-N6)-dimethyltransferase
MRTFRDRTRNGCFDIINKPINTYVIEIDTESVDYLDANYPKLKDKIISKDFLRYDINEVFKENSLL